MMNINTVAIATNSIKNITLGMDVMTAATKATQMEILKKRMMNGEIVRFAYMKKDGSIRFAVGTLQSDAVKANVEGTGAPKRFYGMFAYLDMQKMEWRGFKTENFIGIVG